MPGMSEAGNPLLARTKTADDFGGAVAPDCDAVLQELRALLDCAAMMIAKEMMPAATEA